MSSPYMWKNPEEIFSSIDSFLFFSYFNKAADFAAPYADPYAVTFIEKMDFCPPNLYFCMQFI